MNSAEITFGNLYESYKNMVYSIALEVSPSREVAEEILVSTFVKMHKENVDDSNQPSICISLIKMVIQKAHERLHPGQYQNNFKIRYFERTPLLHSIFCGQFNMDTYCTENRITRGEGAKKLRDEFNSLRASKN